MREAHRVDAACTVHAPPSAAAPRRGVNCRVGPFPVPTPSRPRASLRTAVVWEVLKDALDRRVKATGPEALDVLDTGGGTGNFAVPVATPRPPGHRGRPQPQRALRAGAPGRRGGRRRAGARASRATSTASSTWSSAAATTRCCATASWSTSRTRPRACATRSTRCGPTARSACSPRASAAPCSPGRSPGTSPRPGRRSPTRRAAGATGDPVPRRFTAEQLTELVGDGRGSRSGPCTACGSSPTWSPASWWTPSPGALDALLKLEAAAAELPAFHSVATQLHVLGEKRG